jgi:hypothetical protein
MHCRYFKMKQLASLAATEIANFVEDNLDPESWSLIIWVQGTISSPIMQTHTSP